MSEFYHATIKFLLDNLFHFLQLLTLRMHSFLNAMHIMKTLKKSKILKFLWISLVYNACCVLLKCVDSRHNITGCSSSLFELFIFSVHRWQCARSTLKRGNISQRWLNKALLCFHTSSRGLQNAYPYDHGRKDCKIQPERNYRFIVQFSLTNWLSHAMFFLHDIKNMDKDKSKSRNKSSKGVKFSVTIWICICLLLLVTSNI